MWRILIAALLLVGLSARAQIVTSDVTALPTREWSVQSGSPWYLRVVPVQGVTPMDLTDRRVTMTVRHIDTEALILSSTGTIHRANPGEIIFRWTPTAVGRYRSVADIVRQDSGEIIAHVLDDVIAVTSGASGATVNLSVNPTAQVNVAVSPTATVSVTIQQITTGLLGVVTIPTNAYAPPTTNAGVVTIPIPTNVGGQLSAIDTSKLPLVGGTLTGPMTGTTVYASQFVGPLNWGSVTNAPSLGGITNLVPTNAAAGVPGQIDAQNWTIGTNDATGAGGDVYLASNNTFAGSNNGSVTNSFFGRTIIAAPWEGRGPRAILEMQTSNDVQGIISSVDNGANSEAMLIALKGELASYTGGGNASVRPSTNAATPSGSWPGITLAQYSSGPWLQFGFFSGAGGVFSNVFDLAWFGAPGPAFRINPDQRSNYFFRVFGVTGEFFRLTGHEQLGLGTVVPQAGIHVSNRTLRVDGRFEIGGNSGRNQLTAGVCNIVLPYRMATTNYIVHVSGETGHDSAAREWVSGKTTSNFVVNGTTSNWFAWTAQGITL